VRGVGESRLIAFAGLMFESFGMAEKEGCQGVFLCQILGL
jgi:hypothetical protein